MSPSTIDQPAPNDADAAARVKARRVIEPRGGAVREGDGEKSGGNALKWFLSSMGAATISGLLGNLLTEPARAALVYLPRSLGHLLSYPLPVWSYIAAVLAVTLIRAALGRGTGRAAGQRSESPIREASLRSLESAMNFRERSFGMEKDALLKQIGVMDGEIRKSLSDLESAGAELDGLRDQLLVLRGLNFGFRDHFETYCGGDDIDACDRALDGIEGAFLAAKAGDSDLFREILDRGRDLVWGQESGPPARGMRRVAFFAGVLLELYLKNRNLGDLCCGVPINTYLDHLKEPDTPLEEIVLRWIKAKEAVIFGEDESDEEAPPDPDEGG